MRRGWEWAIGITVERRCGGEYGGDYRGEKDRVLHWIYNGIED